MKIKWLSKLLQVFFVKFLKSYETNLKEIVDVQCNLDFDKYILQDTNYFMLKDDNIRNYVMDILKL